MRQHFLLVNMQTKQWLRPKLLLFAMCSGIADAAETHADWFDFSWKGLLDLRYQYVDASPDLSDNGFGKFRVAGNGNHLRVNEAVVVLQSAIGWDWSSSVTLKYAPRQHNPINLTEAFLSYRPVSTSAWHLNARIGMFFPPLSLENTGTAWSSPYTLSSSVINSWVGEELKTFGGEARINYQFESGDRIGLFGAGLANNDTTGQLLAWRGWKLHDYEATLNDRLGLTRNIHAIFPQQALMSQPFVEVDGRLGYYAGVTAEHSKNYSFRALYYDNRAKPSAIRNGQYAWHTQFYSLGLKVELPWALTIISQGMSGRTRMGEEVSGKFAVDVGFWATSVLLSKSYDIHRMSIRYDRFGTNENDYLPQDINREQGSAWTANYNLTIAKRHQLNFEASYINSDRLTRMSLDQSPNQEEILWQIAYRVFF